MTTFLEGVQKLSRECDTGSAPASVVGQVGEHRRLVDWYSDAYVDIQNRYPKGWRWLRHEFTVNTEADKDVYSSDLCIDSTSGNNIDRLGAWRLGDDNDPAKIHSHLVGSNRQNWLPFLPWENFKTMYRLGAPAKGQPAHISVDPQNNIVLGPMPDAVYVVSGVYYRSPQMLTSNDDVPEMPKHLHNMIVWRAMEDYGYFESAPEVIERGQRKYRKDLRGLESDQLEPISMAGPLA